MNQAQPQPPAQSGKMNMLVCQDCGSLRIPLQKWVKTQTRLQVVGNIEIDPPPCPVCGLTVVLSAMCAPTDLTDEQREALNAIDITDQEADKILNGDPSKAQPLGILNAASA